MSTFLRTRTPNTWLNTGVTLVISLSTLLAVSKAEEAAKTRADLHEPVFRVSKQDREISKTKTAPTAIVSSSNQQSAKDSVSTSPATEPAPVPSASAPPSASSAAPLRDALPANVPVQPVKSQPLNPVAEHPLQSPLRIAAKALEFSKQKVTDYTAVLVKRERVSGRLNDPQYMFCKVRNEKRNAAGTVVTPFSFYLKFLKPGSLKGREVIFVNGANNNKLVAHEGGFKGRFTPCLYLDPNGTLAMMGQRYPATDLGIEKLCNKLIERGNKDMKNGGLCTVNEKQANINQRPTTRIEVVHEKRLPLLDFHKARIYIDNEYGLPVRYEAYDWPATKGAEVSQDDLIEEYTYVRLKLNVGLTDKDFDPANKSYNMK